jgi:hypothetical protein
VFNHTDYLTNPKKYELFKTATVKGDIYTDSGKVLAKGDIVQVEYVRRLPNSLYGRVEPTYKVFSEHHEHEMFASALADFVL